MIIANWKMQKTYRESLQWAKEHSKELSSLTKQAALPIVICPSFESIQATDAILNSAGVCIGAQDCSEHASGSFTGQVSARSLKEIGCSYCIIGHSERRITLQETDESIANKAEQLIMSDIEPIICIGEAQSEKYQTQHVLQNQLKLIIKKYKKAQKKDMIIAYEPVWAIGTGVVPTSKELENAVLEIRNLLQGFNLTLLYGGSVTDQNAQQLKKTGVDGFLLGKSSLDFQMLKKIVLLVQK